jgi:hypothetical protein
MVFTTSIPVYADPQNWNQVSIYMFTSSFVMNPLPTLLLHNHFSIFERNNMPCSFLKGSKTEENINI